MSYTTCTLYPEFNSYFHTYYSTRASTYIAILWFYFPVPLHFNTVLDCGPNVFENFNMVIQTPICFWKGKKLLANYKLVAILHVICWHSFHNKLKNNPSYMNGQVNKRIDKLVIILLQFKKKTCFLKGSKKGLCGSPTENFSGTKKGATIPDEDIQVNNICS